MGVETIIAVSLAFLLALPGAIRSRREAHTEELKGAIALCEVEHDCTLLREKLKVPLKQSTQRIEIPEE